MPNVSPIILGMSDKYHFQYVNKKNYGQVPSYLIKRRAQMNNAKAEYEIWAHEQQAQCQMKVMSPDERINIIQGR